MECSIRNIRIDDATQLVHCANNRNIWINLRDFFPHPYTHDDALWFIEMCNSHETNKIFAITKNDLFIGVIGIHPLTDIYRHTAEIGYWIGEEYWGNGYTSFAVKWMLNYTWVETQINRLEAGVFAHNVISMKILEKSGFTKECIKRSRLTKNNVIQDEHFYAILRSDDNNTY